MEQSAACQEPSASRWSLRPQDHNAVRVRNNQRRHRARIKSRIESLEAELADTQEELRRATARIGELEAELITRGSASAACGMKMDGPNGDVLPETSSQPGQEVSGLTTVTEAYDFNGGDPGGKGDCCRQRCLSVISPSDITDLQQQGQRVPTAEPAFAFSDMIPETPSIPSALLTDKTTAPLSFTLLAQYDHDGRLPPVASGESTTLCQVALQIIAQHNVSGVDESDVEQWLRPGFRRGVKPGEGCRVDTKVLYALIDYMSPL